MGDAKGPMANLQGPIDEAYAVRRGHIGTISRPPTSAPDDCVATHSALLPPAADGCVARTMRKPNGARLMSDAALLLS